MRIINLFIFFLPFLFLYSCNEDGSTKLDLRKKSRGAYGEIVLVMDTAQWNDTLGREIQKCFRSAFPGLPQAESLFTLRAIPPESFDGLLKLSSNILVVSTFDSQSESSKILQSWYSEESRTMVEKDPKLFKFLRKDEFANDQYTLYLFGKTSDDLIENLRANCSELQDFFNQRERKRIASEIFSGKEQTGLSKTLHEKYGFKIRIPFGYDVAREEENFVWLSQLGNDLFRNIYISWKPYKSEAQFRPDSLLAWRSELGRNHLFGSGMADTSSYMTTDERYLPVEFRSVSFNGQYGMELRGLWRLKNFLRGGPFLSFVITDQRRTRIYYVEAFLYAPNRIKRGFMRELEANLHTFKP